MLEAIDVASEEHARLHDAAGWWGNHWCYAVLQACVNDVIDKALELEVADTPPGSSRTTVIVAVAVSVSVVVLLLGGALVWWLRRRARRQQHLSVPGSKTGSADGSSAEAVLVKDG